MRIIFVVEFKEPVSERVVNWGDNEERRFYLVKEYCGDP